MAEIVALPPGSDGGQPCSDQDAAACLAQGNPKSKQVPVQWGMKDRTLDGDGPDDDARKQSFNTGKNRVV